MFPEIVHAQSNMPNVSFTNVGQTGAYGSGAQGGQGADLPYNLPTNSVVGDNSSNPAVTVSSTGGAGGTGQDGGDPTGNGGTGGNGGSVSFSIGGGSQVSSGTTGAAAVVLTSNGGVGGTPGVMSSSGGMPGAPGSGGNSGGVQMSQNGSISSTQGWNGSTPGTTAVLMTANGGDAAQPLSYDGAQGSGKQTGPTGGQGGAGGSISDMLYGGAVFSAGSGVVAISKGGLGGDGTEADSYSSVGTGGAGGVGGTGGNIQIQAGTGSQWTMISAQGAPTAATGAVIPIDAQGNTAQAAVMAAGIQAQSLGGEGGAGGSGDGVAGHAGKGGAAGDAGTVAVQLGPINISTNGFAAAGVLAQSVGGSGGNGPGAGGIFSSKAGNGGTGGSGAAVSINMAETQGATWPTSVISTTGDDSMALVAQSIGGGGGAGGAVETGSLVDGIALGGNGESGGNGGVVSISNGVAAAGNSPAQPGFIISTQGEHSSGIVAQSIGGGGGAGGSATNSVLGIFTMTIGGTGGTGGDAGTPGTTQVSALNEGIVSTTGAHAKGVVAQAVGGGGGDGGSAQALSASGALNVNVSVGGSGGSGGNAGDVTGTNNGEILTNGSDAWGLLTQSIAGGGGNGGMSKSEAFQFAASQEIPSVTLNTSIGGSGGDGGSSGTVSAANHGVVMTAGAAAHGILAQSIAGGGGNGGDSTALSAGASIGKGGKLDVTLAIGGSGGEGGTAGAVNVDNSTNSLVWTLGDSAKGIFAQSVGGGGGAGGTGSGDTKFVGPGGSGGTSTVSVGGLGGAGSAGGTVTVTNEGNLMTMGNSADGIFAQSVGGGGGVATGGTASGSGGKFSEKITLAGSTESGAAGTGGLVNVTNNGSIVTFGGASAGIYAQSVGGGGGAAGTGSTSGSPTVNSGTGSLSDYLSTSAKLQGQTGSYGGVTAWAPSKWVLTEISTMEGWGEDYQTYAANNSSNTPPDVSGGNVAVSAYLGGGAGMSGGPGSNVTTGDGGTVLATNDHIIETFGPASPGILAQSVGAGGGNAGATLTSLSYMNKTDDSTQATISIGGYAMNSGNGGSVNVTNGGVIGTQGDAGFGILAQSIGGGGGQVTVTASNYQASSGGSTPINIYLGGGDTTQGNGGNVAVGNNGTISTAGNEAPGVVAQSVGGGGGDAIVLQTAANKPGFSIGSASPYNTGMSSMVALGSNEYFDPINYPYLAGCQAVGTYVMNSCGNGGSVAVSTGAGSSISTTGFHSHGILAQSIGGGGGWIVGLTPGSADPFVKDPAMGGNGGDINVSVAGTVNTKGGGAYGILAQTVGGGGVLGGYLNDGTTGINNTTIAFQKDSQGNTEGRMGSGGNINIDVSGSVVTSGDYAHAIFAQSVGSGGGLWATTGGVMMGSVGGYGTGNAGSITINNTGTIQATGTGASAIYVNSAGQNSSSQVGIYNSGTITGNTTAPAIMLTGGNSNGDGSVFNSGTITSNGGGTAISAPNSFAAITNNAGGSISGNVQIGPVNGTFVNNGYWGTGNSSTAKEVTNNGTLNINGAYGSGTGAINVYGTSTINGILNNYGQIQTSADFYNNQASSLVAGVAKLQDGTSVYVRPQTLVRDTPVTIMQATAISNAGPIQVTDPGNNFLFNYGITFPTAQQMQVQALGSSFYAQALKYTSNNNDLHAALYLDNLFQSSAMGPSDAQAYAGMATINNGTAYVNLLNVVSNEISGAASVASLTASNAFVERMNSCPRFEDGGLFQREHDCVWGRTIANDSDHGVSSNSGGYHQSSQVFQLGGQKEVAPDWFVGGSVSADNSSLDTHTVNDTVNGKGWTVGLIAKHQMGDWLVSGGLTAGQMSYDASRQMQAPGVSGNATSSFDVGHVGIHSRISRQFAYDSWYLKPYLDLHATHMETSDYAEQGASALNLRAAASKTNVLGASPMLEAGTRFNLSGGMTLQAYAGIGATFYNQGTLGASMQFADSAPGAGSFQVSSDIPQNRFKTTVGLDLATDDHFDLRLEYTGEFADHFRSNTAALKATYKF